MPSVLFDAVVVPGGEDARRRRSATSVRRVEFIKDQYRHCKPILALGAGCSLRRERGRAHERFRLASGIPDCC